MINIVKKELQFDDELKKKKLFMMTIQKLYKMNLVVIIAKMMIQSDNFMVKLYQMKKLVDWSDTID